MLQFLWIKLVKAFLDTSAEYFQLYHCTAFQAVSTLKSLLSIAQNKLSASQPFQNQKHINVHVPR